MQQQHSSKLLGTKRTFRAFVKRTAQPLIRLSLYLVVLIARFAQHGHDVDVVFRRFGAAGDQ